MFASATVNDLSLVNVKIFQDAGAPAACAGHLQGGVGQQVPEEEGDPGQHGAPLGDKVLGPGIALAL